MKISIIMGIYNCDKYLAQSIESILNQTFSDWELIMCDDGSIDNTFEIAELYRKKYPKKIKLIKNIKNMGLNYTLNRCLEISGGEYIARQDGDDISLPIRLEKEFEFLENNLDYAFTSSDMILFDEKGEWGATNYKMDPNKMDFIINSPFSHPSCIIRKKVIDEVDRYTVNKNLLRVEDYHLWFKLYYAGYKGHNIKEYLYKMRDDKDSYTRRKFKYRLNEVRLRFMGFKMLKLPIISYIYVVKPIFVGLMPSFLYNVFRRKKLKREK